MVQKRDFYICSNPECKKEFYGKRRENKHYFCDLKCYKAGKILIKSTTYKKCLYTECKRDFIPKLKEQKFCSQTCSVKHNNVKRSKDIYINVAEKNRLYMKKKYEPIKAENLRTEKYRCRFCGTCFSVKYHIKSCQCLGRKKQQLLDSMTEYFNLSTDNIGSEHFEKDILDCIDYAKSLYDKNSLPEMALLINHKDKTGGNLGKFLKSIGVTLRKRTEALQKLILDGKANISKTYKQGYITLNGKTYFYRSSYELEMAQTLANKNIEFEMETLNIQYYDTQKECDRIAIPDFIFEKEKIIVEVKSNYTYREQEMKDRFEAFSNLGYANYLWLDKEFYILKHDNFTKISDEEFLINFNKT